MCLDSQIMSFFEVDDQTTCNVQHFIAQLDFSHIEKALPNYSSYNQRAFIRCKLHDIMCCCVKLAKTKA